MPEVAPANAIEAAVRFRQDTSLPSGTDIVVGLANDKSTNVSEYGYPLTADEEDVPAAVEVRR